MLRHCHGFNRIPHSDKCQQNTFLAMSLAPCREKRVNLKARHTSHGKLSYEKQTFVEATHTTTRLYARLVSGEPLLSRCVQRAVLSETLRKKSRKL